MWSSFSEAHILKKGFSSHAFGLWKHLWITAQFQICCRDILQDLQVPLLCFSESFPRGVIAPRLEVVVKLIFTLHGWEGGKKALFVYIWFSGGDCEPLAGHGDVTRSAESGSGSSPPLGGHGCFLGNYADSVHACFSACPAGPAWYTAAVSLEISLDLPAQFELRLICSTRLFCDSRDIWPILLLLRRHCWQPCLIITTVVSERRRPLVESSRRPPPPIATPSLNCTYALNDGSKTQLPYSHLRIITRMFADMDSNIAQLNLVRT